MPKVDESAWELETGLPDDIDGYIRNSHFGQKDAYASQVVASGGGAGLQFLCDLEDEEGEIVAKDVGFSVGTTWEVIGDGEAIESSVRRNVVESCMYGKFQKEVVKVLGLDMTDFGLPTVAATWDGLGFHWVQQVHKTVGQRKDGSTEAKSLMPTALLNGGKKKGSKKSVTKKADAGKKTDTSKKADAGKKTDTSNEPDELENKLSKMAKTLDATMFQKAAMKIPGVTDNNTLVASIFDEGEEGFWVTHQS